MNAEHSVDPTGRDADTPDVAGRGQGDLFAIDLQRRRGLVSRKKDQSPVPRARFLYPCPCRPAHQHTVALFQGDQGIKDVNVDLVEVESGDLAFPFPVLATDLEEGQVHGGVARFHQDVSTGAPDDMVTAIKAHRVGVVRDLAHAHTCRKQVPEECPASCKNRRSPHLQGKDVKGRGLQREGRLKEKNQGQRARPM